MADIAACRLTPEQLAINFADAHPPLTGAQAVVESQRCHFCFDAPCIKACPTGIDIPGFIGKIAAGNLRGSALTILEANILGGTCARVCPTEVLCEGACVRNDQEAQPVQIGLLQRHATDWLMQRVATPFTRAPATGRSVAVVGSGPAGLACAHALARRGHEVTMFEARERAGGLNEYGIAAYKMAEDFAQREVGYLLAMGGIRIETGRVLGQDVTLDELRRRFDAVFLGLGQGGVRRLEIEGEDAVGVRNAVDFIAELRQTPPRKVPVGRRVVVIGGGNTAIDAAVQSRLLGAAEVTLIYRRGPEQMSATAEERRWAQTHDVTIRCWTAPIRFTLTRGAVDGVICAATAPEGERLVINAEEFRMEADVVLKAIGQRTVLDAVRGQLELAGDRIAVDADRATSLPGVYAGGDCIAGLDLTVSAVEDGKRAAAAMHRRLSAGEGAVAAGAAASGAGS
jgi:glutamate synthase (NADPH/NADH) small chain